MPINYDGNDYSTLEELLGPQAAADSMSVTLATDHDDIAVTVAGMATETKQDTGNTSLASILAVEGATSDAAITTNTTGSISGKLRGLVTLVVDLLARWPASLGQKTAANSLPVILASDQTVVLTTGTATIGGAKDAGPNWTSAFGVSSAAVSSSDMTTAANISDAPTGGQKIVITDVIISTDTAMRFDVKAETSGTVLLSCYLPASGTVQITPRGRIKLATADKKIQGQASVAGNVRVTALYYSEA